MDDALEWWVGTNKEYMNICGHLATREDAIAEGRDHQCGDPFWIMQARLASWSPPSAVSVIDHMCENADDLFFEDGFDGDLNGTKEEQKAAEDDLQNALNEWFLRHCDIFPTPNAFDKSSTAELIDAPVETQEPTS